MFNGGVAVCVLLGDEFEVEMCGFGVMECYVWLILMGECVVELLFVIEVFMFVGYWFFYLLYKYDCDDLLYEMLLEEIYYYCVSSVQGFGFQCVYIDDCLFDESVVFGDRDCVFVLCGYYIVFVLFGYEVYYFNVMVGS